MITKREKNELNKKIRQVELDVWSLKNRLKFLPGDEVIIVHYDPIIGMRTGWKGKEGVVVSSAVKWGEVHTGLYSSKKEIQREYTINLPNTTYTNASTVTVKEHQLDAKPKPEPKPEPKPQPKK